MRIQLTDDQKRAVGWLIQELVEHERASKDLQSKMGWIFDSWWEEWEDFRVNDDDISVELPNLELPDG